MKEYLGYKVLEDGTVLSKRSGKPISWCDNGKGYMISAFSVNGKRVNVSHHIVVAKVFLGECPEGMEVGHLDGIRSNNHPSNLKYMTKSENNKQSWTDGNRNATGINNANCKYPKSIIISVCLRLQENPKLNVSKLSREMKVGRVTISDIKNRKQWVEISKDYNF